MSIHTLIIGDEPRTFSIAERSRVQSILQNIALILGTRRGSIPMQRDIGLPMEFVDRPTPIAKALAVAEIKQAVEVGEPRARVLGVSFSDEFALTGKLIAKVEVEIQDE